MIRLHNLRLGLDTPEQQGLLRATAKELRISEKDILELRLVKKGIDSRRPWKEVYFICSVDVKCRNEAQLLKKNPKLKSAPPEPAYVIRKNHFSLRPVVVGSGPAGLFSAYTLALNGANPIILERGKSVEQRKTDVDGFRKTGILNPDSNVQFGEGGAGCFSDGKLNTGTNSDANRLVLKTFVECGAPSEILTLAKPHIGTDLLPDVVKNLREKIIALGGTFRFQTLLQDIIIEEGKLKACICKTEQGVEEIPTDTLILAIGHSARDTYEMLYRRGIQMTAKPFAIGMRVEHLQSEVNRSLYQKFATHKALGSADYKLFVHLKDMPFSVYSFCMCPGGTISAAASEEGGLCTNGMSEYARDGRNANSALLVGIEPAYFGGDAHVLNGIAFQRAIERKAYQLSNSYHAPVSLVGDFLAHRCSTGFGSVLPTYEPGTIFAKPEAFLPEDICNALRSGIRHFATQSNGGFFQSEEAVLTGPEMRSSSPVRILRDSETFSCNIAGIYPIGEGAGYAGGITSSAADGIRAIDAILAQKMG